MSEVRLINANELLKRVNTIPRRRGGFAKYFNKDITYLVSVDDVISRIQTAPTVEAEPVRHGSWINGHDTSGWYYKRCSKCHIMVEESFFGFDYDVKYCPNCGSENKATE